MVEISISASHWTTSSYTTLRRESTKNIKKNFTKRLQIQKLVVPLHPQSRNKPRLRKQAEIAQLVEHNLAKVRVASSSLVFRSSFKRESLFIKWFSFFVSPSLLLCSFLSSWAPAKDLKTSSKHKCVKTNAYLFFGTKKSVPKKKRMRMMAHPPHIHIIH